jgi:hypothetical protein
MRSGIQTVGTPFFIGIPSAPGNVPKYESNERFSCTIKMTWRILWIPAPEGERACPPEPADTRIAPAARPMTSRPAFVTLGRYARAR